MIKDKNRNIGIMLGTALAFSGLLVEVAGISGYENRHIRSTPVTPAVIEFTNSVLKNTGH